MNKLFILIFWIGLSLQSFSQVKFTARFEIESELNGPLFETVKFGKSLISFGTITPIATKARKTFQYFESDTNLKTIGLMEYVVRDGFDMLGYDLEGDFLYVLFMKGKVQNPEKYILKIDLISKIGIEFDAQNLVPSDLIEFLVLDDKAVLMGMSDSKPVLQIFDLKEKSILTVQGIFAEDTKIIQVQKLEDIQSLEVIMSRKGKYRSRELVINTYDTQGNLLREVKLKEFGEYGQEVLDGISVPDQAYQQVLAGAFGMQRTGVYQGVYLMNINEFGGYEFKLYTPEDFPNFFSFLGEKQKIKKDETIRKRIENGKKISFPEVFSIRAIQETADAYLLFFDHLKIINGKGRVNSGLYSPTGFYRFDRLWRMGYNPTLVDLHNPNQIPISTYQQIIPEYQYISAHFVKIGKEGNVIWDNSIPYNDINLVYPNVFAEIAVVGEEVYHTYMEEQKIKLNYLKKGEKIFDGLNFDLELLNQTERLVQTNPESLKISHWYDRYFLITGTQEIRFVNDQGKEDRREVFFLTKISVDGELYVPKDQKD